jgi:hypothetical protein
MPVTSPSRARRAPRDLPVLVLCLGLFVVSLLGLTTGSTQVTAGPVEVGQGAYVGEQSPAYWTWLATQLSAVPTPAPAAASTNPAAPTMLPFGGRSYAINPATAGSPAVRWEFAEQTTAPRSTELELRFMVGISAATVLIKIYVETNAFPPYRAHDYYLYWGAGTYPPTTLTIATEQATVLVCSAVGTCP